MHRRMVVDQVGQSFLWAKYSHCIGTITPCAAQTVECKQAQGWRAINQNEVVVGIQ